MIDLSTLPWNECELPDFNEMKVSAAKSPAGNFAYIEAVGHYPVASQRKIYPYVWHIMDCTLDEYEQILAMCRTVERFIQDHKT
jgi:hypothetical protein